MDQMAVDIQKAGAVIGLIDHMVIPDFVVKCASGHGSLFQLWGNRQKARNSAGRGSKTGENRPQALRETPGQAVVVGHVEETDHGGDIRALQLFDKRGLAKSSDNRIIAGKPSRDAAMTLIELTVTLIDLPYPVTRKLTVPEDLGLKDLHLVLQAAMGWDNSHLYDFSCGRRHRWTDMALTHADEYDHVLAKSSLADIVATLGKLKSFTYTYDMGDSWEHVLRASKPRAAAAGEVGIALTDATGACPPDDSGGVPGFSHMLECLDDPACAEYAEYLEWMGGEAFDRTADVADLTQRVAAIGKRLAKRTAG